MKMSVRNDILAGIAKQLGHPSGARGRLVGAALNRGNRRFVSAAVRALQGAIWHVHAKDTNIQQWNSRINGVLDTKHYADELNRSWIFRTVGYGHGAEWWSEFISTLRMYGYDYVLSIEHEDSLLSPEEGLTKAIRFLDAIVIKEKPTAAWWV